MAGPANVYEIVWWWGGQGNSGGEKWAVQGAFASPAGLLDAVVPMYNKRALCLAREYSMLGLRVSQFTDGFGNRVRRRAALKLLNVPGQQTDIDQKPNFGIATRWDLLLQCYDGAGRLKLQYMAGLPRLAFQGNAFVSTPQVNAVFPGFIDDITNFGFGWVGTFQAGADGTEAGLPFVVTNYTQDANTGLVTVTVNPAITFAGLDGRDFTVHFNFGGKFPLDGRHAVRLPVDPLTGALITNKVQIVKPMGVRPFGLAQPGTMRILQDSFYQMKASGGLGAGYVLAVKGVERKRGNSFPGGRGKRPRTVQW